MNFKNNNWTLIQFQKDVRNVTFQIPNWQKMSVPILDPETDIWISFLAQELTVGGILYFISTLARHKGLSNLKSSPM